MKAFVNSRGFYILVMNFGGIGGIIEINSALVEKAYPANRELAILIKGCVNGINK